MFLSFSSPLTFQSPHFQPICLGANLAVLSKARDFYVSDKRKQFQIKMFIPNVEFVLFRSCCSIKTPL